MNKILMFKFLYPCAYMIEIKNLEVSAGETQIIK